MAFSLKAAVSGEFTRLSTRTPAKSSLSNLSVLPSPLSDPIPILTSVTALQVDLEATDDDIQEIQQEISVLATCASPYVTQYKQSFVRGTKLWIVMEYLGGGSCLDLVCAASL